MLKDFYKSERIENALRRIPGSGQIRSYLDRQCQKGNYDVYDLALVLNILYKRDGYYRSAKYPAFLDYLVIDEAQDFTVAELEAILNALEDKTQLTLAGDLGQKILENRDFGTWEDLLGEIGMGHVDVLNLQVAYRSTYQIYEMAEYVRDPHLNEDDLKLTPKFGPEPTLTKCSTYVDATRETVKWLDDLKRVNPHSVSAIICKSASLARHVYDSLLKAGARGIRLGDAGHFEFSPGITVTDIKQVKGLEFHNVLLFNPSADQYRKENVYDRNLLYVAVTRAAFKFDIVCCEEPSPLIPDFIQTIDLTQDILDEDKPLFSDRDQDLSRFDKDEEEFD